MVWLVWTLPVFRFSLVLGLPFLWRSSLKLHRPLDELRKHHPSEKVHGNIGNMRRNQQFRWFSEKESGDCQHNGTEMVSKRGKYWEHADVGAWQRIEWEGKKQNICLLLEKFSLWYNVVFFHQSKIVVEADGRYILEGTDLNKNTGGRPWRAVLEQRGK